MSTEVHGEHLCLKRLLLIVLVLLLRLNLFSHVSAAGGQTFRLGQLQVQLRVNDSMCIEFICLSDTVT